MGGWGRVPRQATLEMFLADGDRRQSTREGIEAVLKIWTDPEPGHYKRRFFWEFIKVPQDRPEYRQCPHEALPETASPPIAMADRPRDLTHSFLRVKRGWIPMSINLAHVPIIKTHWDAVEEGAEKAGLSPSRSTWRIAREVYVADTTEQARKEALEGTLGRDFRDYWF